MIKTRLICSLIFMLYSSFSFAQNKTYFGIETARTKSLFIIGGDDLKLAPLNGVQFGFNAGRELNKYITLEIGASRNLSNFGYGDANQGKIDFEINIFNSLQFPLRLKTNVNLYREKIYFNINNAFVFCMNDLNNGAAAGLSSYTMKSFFWANNKARYFPLFQIGSGMEFKIRKKTMLGISANYYGGLTEVYEARIDYRINQKNEKTTYAISKSDYWNIACSLRYPISNFWQKKDN